MAVIQKEVSLASGNSAHVSSDNTLALTSRPRKHLNEQSNSCLFSFAVSP